MNLRLPGHLVSKVESAAKVQLRSLNSMFEVIVSKWAARRTATLQDQLAIERDALRANLARWRRWARQLLEGPVLLIDNEAQSRINFLCAEAARMRPVIEAAERYINGGGASEETGAARDLHAAVSIYRTACQGCGVAMTPGPTGRDDDRYARQMCGACEELRSTPIDAGPEA